MSIKIKTIIPGPESSKILKALEKKNGGWGVSYPFVHAIGKGKGAYFGDIDGNMFLDFGSQIASNPLGYNHPALVEIVKYYGKYAPMKYAGQDFVIEEHLGLIEELLAVSPRGMNAAFLVNSGAEAVENAIKIAMYRREKKKFTVSLNGAFHGRTLGALSLHHANPIHRKGFMRLPNRELPCDDSAGSVLREIIRKNSAESVVCVILEHFQGEGSYKVLSQKMVRDLWKVCKRNKIPYVADEVQSGMGRTGKWWAFQHYGIVPDVFSSAKALQVGACVARKSFFPDVPGSISSTWGGGSVIDLALGIRTIEVIKHDDLLKRNRIMGNYIRGNLRDMHGVNNVRGLGMMIAFDLVNKNIRDNVIIECVKRGLVVLGAGDSSIRVIPPYIIEKEDVDKGLEIIEDAIRVCEKKGFKHIGHICRFLDCGESVS